MISSKITRILKATSYLFVILGLAQSIIFEATTEIREGFRLMVIIFSYRISLGLSSPCWKQFLRVSIAIYLYVFCSLLEDIFFFKWIWYLSAGFLSIILASEDYFGLLSKYSKAYLCICSSHAFKEFIRPYCDHKRWRWNTMLVVALHHKKISIQIEPVPALCRNVIIPMTKFFDRWML